MTEEEKRVREEIRRLKVDTTQVLRGNADACYLTEHDINQILSIKGIRIECDTQELPECSRLLDNTPATAHHRLGYAEALDDIRKTKDGKVWVQCERKEK